MARYQRPDWFTKNVFNPAVALATKLGLSLWGSRVLAVRGRKSGETRTTPVNVLTFEGRRYLVAPRGATQWVRNVRAAGGCELRVGRRREQVRVTELADEAKPALLRAYLKRWKWEAGQFFGGVGHESPEDDLRRIAPNHPVFLLDLEPGA